MGLYWLGKTKLSDQNISDRNIFKKLLRSFIFKKNIQRTEWLPAWHCLPDWLMPSDKCNLTMAKAIGLIFFCCLTSLQPERCLLPYLYIQCILHGLTRALLSVPFIFAHHKKCWFCGRCMMASICKGNCSIGYFDAEVFSIQLLNCTAV